jgi:hypothetical protein
MTDASQMTATRVLRRIKKGDVRKAIHYINVNGVPTERKSKSCSLYLHGRRYPAKYVVQIAAFQAKGRSLKPSEYTSTQSRRVLERLKFHVINSPSSAEFSLSS